MATLKVTKMSPHIINIYQFNKWKMMYPFKINYLPVTKNLIPNALAITNVPDTVVPPFKPYNVINPLLEFICLKICTLNIKKKT